jgi:transposase
MSFTFGGQLAEHSRWHCCIEAKSVLAMHHAGRQDPSGTLENPLNRTSEGLSHGVWGSEWSRSGGPIAQCNSAPGEMLRMLKLAKDSAVKARTQTINQVKAVLVAADPQLREALSGLTNTMLIRRCAQLESTTPQDVTSAAVYTLRLLARRILQLTPEIHDLVRHITDTITRHCPRLLTRPSPPATTPTDCTARPPSPPCAGSTPLEASSGKTSRRRLNRGGDRQANCALYRIAICRLRCDARTRDYLARRITEGKTRREAIRGLKRYLAREIYQIIASPPEAEPSAA